MKEKLIGKKDLYRTLSSLQVVDTIFLCGSLITCIELGCRTPNIAYKQFVDAFNKLYLSTALFTNNSVLIRQIESAFNEGWKYTSKKSFNSKSQNFINLFKAYIVQMKEDGLYNPEITFKDKGLDDVWRESV